MKIIRIPIIYVFLFLVSSCLKDNGSYDYITLPSVNISGVSSTYRVFLMTPFKVQPLVKTDIKDDDLQYLWIMGGDTISREKKLEYMFTNESIKTYNLVFEVFDKINKVRYSHVASLAIVSPYQTGWAILSQNTDRVSLNFWSYEGDSTLFKDVYQTVNGEDLDSKTYSVMQLIGYETDRMAIFSKGATSVELDASTFVKVKNYQNEFRATVPFSPIGSNFEQFNNERYLYIINSDGKMYGKSVGYNSVDAGWYQYPMEADMKGYKIGPYTAQASQYDPRLAYDELNGRYLHFVNNPLSLMKEPVKSSNVQAFDLSNFKGKQVWMGRSPGTSDNKVWSILKTPENKYVLHIIGNEWNSGSEKWTAEKNMAIPDGVITDASVIVAHKQTPYILIGTGNKLYALNTAASGTDQMVNLLNTYEADITAMSYANYFTAVNELAIAIDTQLPNNERGSLLILETDLSERGKIKKRKDGLGGKVVSIGRRRNA